MSKKLSRQREWQKKQIADGRCMLCAEPLVTAMHCETHRQLVNKISLDRYHAKKQEAESVEKDFDFGA